MAEEAAAARKAVDMRKACCRSEESVEEGWIDQRQPTMTTSLEQFLLLEEVVVVEERQCSDCCSSQRALLECSQRLPVRRLGVEELDFRLRIDESDSAFQVAECPKWTGVLAGDYLVESKRERL